MSETSTATAPATRGGVLRRVAPAVGLFLLAPIVAEYLLGDLPITLLVALIVLAPLYGGGALLIREVTRRLGRGVPTMMLLGLAYGVLEEGLISQSLFNPNYAGQRLLDSGFVPALGIGGPWTVYVLTLHTVWSTTVPILLVEALVPARRTTPWLGRIGLAVTAVLFVLGGVGSWMQQQAEFAFTASVPQMVGAAVVAVVLVTLAVRLPRRAGHGPGPVPAAWLLGLLALVLGSAFMIDGLRGTWVGVTITLLVDAALAAVLVRWSTRAAWTPLHTLAGAAGAVFVYAWYAFPQPTLFPTPLPIDLASNAIFAALVVVVVTFGINRTRRA